MNSLLRSILNCLSTRTIRGIRIGVFGSIARGDYTNDSDIDIVIDADEDMQSINFMEELRSFVCDTFNRSCDVTYLCSMQAEDEELDRLGESLGLGKNEFSAYKTLMKEVIWCE